MAMEGKGVAHNATGFEMPDIASIEIFVVASETGSLAKTATHLGVSVSTASRRLERLESALGGPVFERLHSGLQLTAVGLRALPQARKIRRNLAALVSATGAPQSSEPRRRTVITIGAPEGLGAFWIARFVSPFLDVHPDTILCFETRSVLGAERKRPPDVIVSVGPPLNGDVIRVACGGMHFVAFDGPSSIGEIGQQTSRLAEHVDYIGTSQWLDPSEEAIGVGREFSLRTDSTSFLTTALQCGAGRALFPNFWHLLVDGLTPVDGSPAGYVPVYVSFNKEFAQQTNGREVIDWLKCILKMPSWFGRDYIPANQLTRSDLHHAEDKICRWLAETTASAELPLKVAAS
ncbi:LysR family transcriptional regulator [Pyruvatibacter sp.]